MTVKELKAELEKVDENLIVILQKDSEGNGYSPLSGIDDNATYSPYNTWSGYVSAKKLTPELIKSGFTSDDLNIHGQSCIVLFPIN